MFGFESQETKDKKFTEKIGKVLANVGLVRRRSDGRYVARGTKNRKRDYSRSSSSRSSRSSRSRSGRSRSSNMSHKMRQFQQQRELKLRKYSNKIKELRDKMDRLDPNHTMQEEDSGAPVATSSAYYAAPSAARGVFRSSISRDAEGRRLSKEQIKLNLKRELEEDERKENERVEQRLQMRESERQKALDLAQKVKTDEEATFIKLMEARNKKEKALLTDADAVKQGIQNQKYKAVNEYQTEKLQERKTDLEKQAEENDKIAAAYAKVPYHLRIGRWGPPKTMKEVRDLYGAPPA